MQSAACWKSSRFNWSRIPSNHCLQVRSLLRSHSQGERSRASLAPGLYHPSPSIFSPSWSDRQGAVDDGAITGLRMRRSSAVRRPTPCHFSSLSSLLVHSSLFFRPTHGQVCRAFAMDYDYIYDPMHRREGGQYDTSSPGSSSPLVASIWTSGTPHGM